MGKFFLSTLILFSLCFWSCSQDSNKSRYVTRHTNPRNTQTNYPFLSGDVFRSISDHIVDDTHVPFFPKKVKEKDIVFVKTKYLQKFVKYMHPHIKHPYILITHNGDEEIPGDFRHLLEDPKIIVWFGMNTTEDHPKLKPLPIGYGNTHETTYTVTDQRIFELLNHPLQKERLVYLNFDERTYPERAVVKDFFSSKSFCTIEPRKSFNDYIGDVMSSKFIISPRGSGIDCCRVWESLNVGTIPILKSSPLDPLYQHLPILIVNDWSEVTEEFLEEKYQEMAEKEYELERMYADFWIKQIYAYTDREFSQEQIAKHSRLKECGEGIDITMHFYPCGEGREALEGS